MAWHTEWEFKGEFLNVSKQSQIGLTAAAVDEVAAARLLYLPLTLCTQRSALRCVQSAAHAARRLTARPLSRRD